MSISERAGNKLAHVDRQVAALKRHEKVIARIGGYTTESKGEEIAFHERCRAVLAWAQNRSASEVEAKVREVEQSIPAADRAAVLAAKYGIVVGLPLEYVEAIRKIELLEVALGTHPGVQR